MAKSRAKYQHERERMPHVRVPKLLAYRQRALNRIAEIDAELSALADTTEQKALEIRRAAAALSDPPALNSEGTE